MSMGAFLGTIFRLILSPVGIMAFFMGLVVFFLMPFIPRATNMFHSFARFHQRLAGLMLKRAAIVVSEHGDLLLKRMSPDDAGTEKIEFSDDTKEFEDTNEAKDWWLGMAFALADEVHGVLYTPLDAALGRRKMEAEQGKGMLAKATSSEREKYGVQGWVRGVFEFPRDKYELVNLNNVRYMMTGSERAEHPQKIKSFYELSREPYKDGPSAARLIMIVVALIGPFAAMWVLSSQLGSSASSSVSFSLLALLISGISLREYIDVDLLKKIGKGMVIVVPLPLIIVLLAVFVSPIYAAAVLVLFSFGFGLMPVMTQLLKFSDSASVAMSRLLLKLGLTGYDEPVLEFTPHGYETREFRNLGSINEEQVHWHTFLGRKFGFTFTPDPDVWDNEVVPNDDIQNASEIVTDGGKARQKESGDTRNASGVKTQIPAGFTRIPEQTRAVYGDFVPSTIKASKYYVSVGIALERFTHVAVGQKSHKRLRQAKEEFGGDSALADRTIAFLMAGLGTLSFLTGILVFVAPMFL